MIRDRRNVRVGRRRREQDEIAGNPLPALPALHEPRVGDDDVIGSISHGVNQSSPGDTRWMCSIEQRHRGVHRVLAHRGVPYNRMAVRAIRYRRGTKRTCRLIAMVALLLAAASI